MANTGVILKAVAKVLEAIYPKSIIKPKDPQIPIEFPVIIPYDPKEPYKALENWFIQRRRSEGVQYRKKNRVLSTKKEWFEYYCHRSGRRQSTARGLRATKKDPKPCGCGHKIQVSRSIEYINVQKVDGSVAAFEKSGINYEISGLGDEVMITSDCMTLASVVAESTNHKGRQIMIDLERSTDTQSSGEDKAISCTHNSSFMRPTIQTKPLAKTHNAQFGTNKGKLSFEVGKIQVQTKGNVNFSLDPSSAERFEDVGTPEDQNTNVTRVRHRANNQDVAEDQEEDNGLAQYPEAGVSSAGDSTTTDGKEQDSWDQDPKKNSGGRPCQFVLDSDGNKKMIQKCKYSNSDTIPLSTPYKDSFVICPSNAEKHYWEINSSYPMHNGHCPGSPNDSSHLTLDPVVKGVVQLMLNSRYSPIYIHDELADFFTTRDIDGTILNPDIVRNGCFVPTTKQISNMATNPKRAMSESILGNITDNNTISDNNIGFNLKFGFNNNNTLMGPKYSNNRKMIKRAETVEEFIKKREADNRNNSLCEASDEQSYRSDIPKVIDPIEAQATDNALIPTGASTAMPSANSAIMRQDPEQLSLQSTDSDDDEMEFTGSQPKEWEIYDNDSDKDVSNIFVGNINNITINKSVKSSKQLLMGDYQNNGLSPRGGKEHGDGGDGVTMDKTKVSLTPIPSSEVAPSFATILQNITTTTTITNPTTQSCFDTSTKDMSEMSKQDQCFDSDPLKDQESTYYHVGSDAYNPEPKEFDISTSNSFRYFIGVHGGRTHLQDNPPELNSAGVIQDTNTAAVDIRAAECIGNKSESGMLSKPKMTSPLSWEAVNNTHPRLSNTASDSEFSSTNKEQDDSGDTSPAGSLLYQNREPETGSGYTDSETTYDGEYYKRYPTSRSGYQVDYNYINPCALEHRSVTPSDLPQKRHPDNNHINPMFELASSVPGSVYLIDGISVSENSINNFFRNATAEDIG